MRFIGIVIWSSLFGQTPNSQQWAEMLQRHVQPVTGRVDYPGVVKDQEKLHSFLRSYEGWQPQNELERKAGLINFYNAAMIDSLLGAAKKEGIDPSDARFLNLRVNEIKSGRIWKNSLEWKLRGWVVSLDDVEHGMLRGQNKKDFGEWAAQEMDPRIHSAVNCAAISCPRLREKPYVAEQLEAMLNDNMREFVNDRRQFRMINAKKMKMNSIVWWYYDDFDKLGAGHFLAAYLDEKSEAAIFLRSTFNHRNRWMMKLSSDFEFHYDWRINDQRQKMSNE